MDRKVDDRPAAVTPLGTAPAFLRIRGLTKRFGKFAALRDISLEIASNEFVCFLGPSGCGKTTLLRVIAGLDVQDEGVIEMAGRDVSSLPPAGRDYGIVFQSYALFPNLKVVDNVGYGLVNKRLSRARVKARVAELLALVGLTDQGNKYPVQLSGGQQQRVALARALATSPSLLLLDEPLSALDARVRLRLRDEIKSLQRRLGVTTIMVTHDQEEALAMADRIVVMNHGAVEQVGTPAAIYARPSTAFVADFIGTMTFLSGMVRGPSRVGVEALELSCPAVDGFAVGTPVRVGLRPEEVRIRGIETATPNRFPARVKALHYLGSFCRATLEPEAAPSLAVICDFSANAMRDLGITEGQTIPIVLPQEALRVFPAQDAS